MLSIILSPCSEISQAESTAETSEKPKTTKAETTSQAVPAEIIFVPFDFGAPEVTEAGGVRSLSLVPIKLLAPEQLSRTLSQTPTFYWHLDRAIDEHRFTLIDDQGTEQLLEVILDPVEKAGIYSLSLADHDIILETPGRYRWSITTGLDQDPAAAETVAQTAFAYEGPVEDAPMDGPAAELSGYLAENGYWYDLLDLMSKEASAVDGERWNALRDDLLKQVGITLQPR